MTTVSEEATSETVDVSSAVGSTIRALHLDEDTNVLHIGLMDGSTLLLKDDGQSCCEYRYMRTDDKLEDYVGGKLLGAEIKTIPYLVDFWDAKSDENVHDVQFLEITTTKGSFVISSHNEHNGYYGGFYIVTTHKK